MNGITGISHAEPKKRAMQRMKRDMNQHTKQYRIEQIKERAKRWIVLNAAVLAFSSVVISSLNAAVTITSPNAGFASSSVYFYAASTAANEALIGGFIDPAFQVLDLTKTAATDTAATEAILFDVSTDKTFSVATGEQLVVTVFAKDTDGDYQLVPIGYAGTALCSDQSNCQADRGSNRLYAARYTEGSTLRIGVYPTDICTYIYTIDGNYGDGCTTALSSTDADTKILTLKVKFQVVKDGTTVDAGTDTTYDITSEFEVFMQNFANGTLTCPANLAELYSPGDKSIFFDAANVTIGLTSSSAAAPVALVFAGKKSGTPSLVDSTYTSASVNDLASSISISGTQAVTGFTNTTDGTDNTYNLAIAVRDAAGIITTRNEATAAACKIDGVQTSSVNGFLAKSACFIATAATDDDSRFILKTLRIFRNEILGHYSLGWSFTRWYYSWSPSAAKWLNEHALFKPIVRTVLWPISWVAYSLIHPICLAMVFGILALIRIVFKIRKFKKTTYAKT